MADPTDKPHESEQNKESAWHDQWLRYTAEQRFLFEEWIRPATVEDLRDQEVLEGGCGGGQHTAMMAPYAKSITSVDLNTTDLAQKRNQENTNATFVEADLGTMDLGRQFDVVLSIGVIHHTDDPDRTFENLYRHLRPGGRMIVWTYSAEGNGLMRWFVEPARKLFLSRLPISILVALSWLLNLAVYPLVYTVYFLPLRFLPYYEYFANSRRMTPRRNMLNILDKLNAPQTHFTTLETAKRWMNSERFEPDSISVRPYVGVSYSLVGVKRSDS